MSREISFIKNSLPTFERLSASWTHITHKRHDTNLLKGNESYEAHKGIRRAHYLFDGLVRAFVSPQFIVAPCWTL